MCRISLKAVVAVIQCFCASQSASSRPCPEYECALFLSYRLHGLILRSLKRSTTVCPLKCKVHHLPVSNLQDLCHTLSRPITAALELIG